MNLGRKSNLPDGKEYLGDTIERLGLRSWICVYLISFLNSWYPRTNLYSKPQSLHNHLVCRYAFHITIRLRRFNMGLWLGLSSENVCATKVCRAAWSQEEERYGLLSTHKWAPSSQRSRLLTLFGHFCMIITPSYPPKCSHKEARTT